MPSLNISKVAVGCANLDALGRRQAMRAVDGVVPVYTRFRPKRADELIGGSIYWIIKHVVAARQTILAFDDDPAVRRTIVRLNSELIRVQPQPRRAHQGWRYLDLADAPADLESAGALTARLPPMLFAQLSQLALI